MNLTSGPATKSCQKKAIGKFLTTSSQNVAKICELKPPLKRMVAIKLIIGHINQIEKTGVGKLMETAIKLGKPVNPNLHVGICGEHGGDPSSVEFCHKIGLDYVSCSPFRVPIARLAAAQAAIAEQAK